MAGGKALHDEVNERVRQAILNLMSTRGWNQARAGKELDVTQQSISTFLSKTNGASLFLAWEIAKKCGVPLDDLLTGEANSRAGWLVFRDLPGWAAHEAAARQLFSHVPPRAFEAVADWGGLPLPAITAMVIGTMAEAWWKAECSAAAQAAISGPTVDDEPVVPANSVTRRRDTKS